MTISFEVYESLLNRVISLSVELERESTARKYFEQKASVASLPPTLTADVIRLVRLMSEDSLIEAIKAYRALTGMPLKESKDAVEKVMRRAPQ